MTRRNYTCMWQHDHTKTHMARVGARVSAEQTTNILQAFTKHPDSAFLGRHHQGRATRLVDGIDWCIMGEEQLDTVHVTREGCCMEGGPVGGRERG